jgi:hypothetical protein
VEPELHARLNSPLDDSSDVTAEGNDGGAEDAVITQRDAATESAETSTASEEAGEDDNTSHTGKMR